MTAGRAAPVASGRDLDPARLAERFDRPAPPPAGNPVPLRPRQLAARG